MEIRSSYCVNNPYGTPCVLQAFFLLLTLIKLYSVAPHFVIQSAKWIVSGHHLTFYLIETPLNAFANEQTQIRQLLQELPDQGLLCLS